MHVSLTLNWTLKSLAGYVIMAFMSRCCIILKSSRLQSVLGYLNVVLHLVFKQLQINAVMKHTMKIAEKYSGIHVKCFNSWISESSTEAWQLHHTVNNQFPLRDMNTLFSHILFLSSHMEKGKKGPFSSL